jgi:TctA family transporter
MLSFGSPMIVLHRPIAAALVGLTAIVLLKPVIARMWAAGRRSTGGPPRPAREHSR